MSLQVWLPFIKGLTNQGISSLSSITLASGNSLTANGKLGGQAITLTKLQTILPASSSMTGAKEMSYAFWAKVNTAWEAQWLDGIRWISTDGSTTHTSRQEFYTNCTKVGTWFQGSSIAGKDFTPGVWTHIAGTFNYNTGEAKFYLNGILQGTSTALATTHYCRGDFYIGDNGIDLSENDVRIYDHCLSQKEIEEIAKGLVLHYKLSQPVNINYNLYTGSKDFSGSWGNGSLWITATENYNGFVVKQKSSTWGGLYQNINCAAGDIFTISFWAKVESGGNILSIHRSSLGNVTTGLTILDGNFIAGTDWMQAAHDGTQWNRYWATLQITSADITYLQWRIENSVANKNLYIAGLTLEKGYGTKTWSLSASEANNNNIIYDSSGYNNNGTAIGDIQIDVNTIKYSHSIKKVNGQYIRVDRRPAECMPKDAITVNIWQYATTWGNPISCTEGGGWNFENSSGIRFPVYISGVGYKVAQSSITTASTLNAWHMLTGTMDADNIKIYYDGEEVGTIATGSTNGIGYANNYIFIGGEAGGNSTSPANSSYVGNISDVRIYATALTPKQIKELYDTSATIDNKGNIYARELVEI